MTFRAKIIWKTSCQNLPWDRGNADHHLPPRLRAALLPWAHWTPQMERSKSLGLSSSMASIWNTRRTHSISKGLKAKSFGKVRRGTIFGPQVTVRRSGNPSTRLLRVRTGIGAHLRQRPRALRCEPYLAYSCPLERRRNTLPNCQFRHTWENSQRRGKPLNLVRKRLASETKTPCAVQASRPIRGAQAGLSFIDIVSAS